MLCVKGLTAWISQLKLTWQGGLESLRRKPQYFANFPLYELARLSLASALGLSPVRLQA